MPLANEHIPDELIVRQVLQGNVDHFRTIIDRYKNLIHTIGMRFFRNEEESSDFVQDVMIKTYENLKTYKGRAPFRYWLTKIAYNLGINRKSSLKEERELPHAIPASGLSPEEDHLQAELKETLSIAIDALPEKYQICLDFYFFWGLSYSQIFEITGFPVNTIKSHVMRAKQMLRDWLKGTMAEEFYEMR